MAPTVGVVALWFLVTHLEEMVACNFLKMGQDLVDDLLIFDTGDNLDGATTMSAGFNINVEYPFPE